MGALTDRGRSIRANLAVGQKLAVGFGLVAVVLVVLVAVTFVAIARLDAANATEDRAIEQVNAATDVQHRAAVMRAEQLTYVTSPGQTRAAYEAAARSFETALDELRITAATPTERALVNKISTGYQTFLAIDQFVWQALLDGNTTAAHNYVFGAAALDFGFMAADADTFVAEAVRTQRQTSIDFVETRDQTRVVVAALGILALVLVAGASRGIARLIRDPLLEVQRAAVQAADGNLEAEAPVHGCDEIGTLATAFNSMLRQLRHRESKMIEQHNRAELAHQVDTALEMAETEDDIYNFVSRSLEEIAPERSSELLLADNSRAHFTQVAVAGCVPEGPGCRVSSPNSCPAVRAATKMTFDDSDCLDSCLHLNSRPTGPRSATCVPVSFMGRSVGVLHSTGPAGEQIDEEVSDGLEMLARATGGRVGVIRSTARSQLHATTDGLTGLFNRRTFESRVRAMHRNGEQFALVMADLDQFKLLNDTYGHEAGDRALRLFSRVLQETVRERDIVCRWGGEEFTIALVDTNVTDAASMLERLRVELTGRIATSEVNAFTASYGYVDASACHTFEAAIRLADGALYAAKDAGRDTAVAADPPPLPVGHAPPIYDPDDDDGADFAALVQRPQVQEI